MTTIPNNPNEFSDANPAALPATRPASITIIGVIALLLGIVGVLTSGAGLAAQFAMPVFQNMIIEQAEANPEDQALQTQAKMQKATMEMAQKYNLLSSVVMIATALACVLLFVASILLLRSSPAAPKLFVIACALVLLADLGKTVASVITQREAFAVMGDNMAEMVDAEGDNEAAAKGQEMAGQAMKVFGLVAMVFAGGWFLLKAGFYIWSMTYMSKPAVKQYFEARAT